MAILSKIRDRSVALIIVIGLALFAFVLDPSTLTDFFNSSKINEVGVVDGEPISRQEYAEALENYKSRNRRVTEMQASKAVWNLLVGDKIYEQQLGDAGVTLGETDIWNKIISTPFIQNNPQFQNEAGLFDEDRFKLYLTDIQQAQDQSVWNSWRSFMNQLRTDFKKSTYNNLVNAGLGASLKEGENQYKEDNILFSADLVYVPYTSIPDSLINVSKKDIEAYIKKHPKQNKVEASRDISYVKFEIKPTEQDKEDIKNEVAKFLEDRKEYSNVTKSEITIKGLKNTTDYEVFFQESNSDIPYEESYFMSYQFPENISKELFAKKVNETYGPYEDAGFYRISKITEIVQRADSVKSSHILIPFVGSQAANADTKKTEEQAKKSADSIFRLVRNNKDKFAKIADEINTDGTKGKGGDIGWVRQQQAFSPSFDADFANFIYGNKKGKVGVVKSKFGFHIIRIDDQTKELKSIKVVTFGRQILASQETENDVFQKAENFSLEVTTKYKNFQEAVKENKYNAQPGIGLKIFDDFVPGLGSNQREIVAWTFNKDSKVGDFKRFDVDNGYIVACITNKTNEGLKSAAKAAGTIKPILVNEKKAEMIKEKMNGATLNDIATGNGVRIRKMNGVTLKAPSISGVGSEPKIIGSMMYAKENELYNKIAGNKGVFAFVVTKKEQPTVLTNYESFRERIANQRRNKTFNVLEALKKASKIEDNRDIYYGIDQ